MSICVRSQIGNLSRPSGVCVNVCVGGGVREILLIQWG